MTLSRSTLARQAYTVIRATILSGELRPGQPVAVRPLSESLGLSATPIKAALSALQGEGLLVAIPHRGFFVSEMTFEDMDEINELREVIDGIAARRAAATEARLQLAADLTKLLDRQRDAAEAGDFEAYNELDAEFHSAVWRASGNQRLLHVGVNLLGQLNVGGIGSAQVPGRLALALEEHGAIISAIQSGRPAKAESATRMHVRRAGAALHQYLQFNGADEVADEPPSSGPAKLPGKSKRATVRAQSHEASGSTVSGHG